MVRFPNCPAEDGARTEFRFRWWQKLKKLVSRKFRVDTIFHPIFHHFLLLTNLYNYCTITNDNHVGLFQNKNGAGLGNITRSFTK